MNNVVVYQPVHMDYCYYHTNMFKWDKYFFNLVLYSPKNHILDNNEALKFMQDFFIKRGIGVSTNEEIDTKFTTIQYIDCLQDLFLDLYSSLNPQWLCLLGRYVYRGGDTNHTLLKINKSFLSNVSIHDLKLDEKINTQFKLMLKS